MYHPGEQEVVVTQAVALIFAFGVCPAGQSRGWVRPPVQMVNGGQGKQSGSEMELVNLATATRA